MPDRAEAVNEFWFVQGNEEDWCKKDLEFDKEVKNKCITNHRK